MKLIEEIIGTMLEKVTEIKLAFTVTEDFQNKNRTTSKEGTLVSEVPIITGKEIVIIALRQENTLS